MSDYWLGVLTTPMALLCGWVATDLFFRTLNGLARFGITFGANWSRDLSPVSHYTLRHDVWWERSVGPIFVGGWYHETATYKEPSQARFNRWIGFGLTTGPNVMAFRKCYLGEVE